MKSNYKRLGDIIKPVSIKNRDLLITDLRGVNYQKYFMPSVANTIGVDLSTYKIIEYNQFACNLMHVGRDGCLPIAIHQETKPIIVSPAYFSFCVKDDSEILPFFLFMWFKRKEFDRQACFYTDADVRQGLVKEAFYNLMIPIPSIEGQRKIVNEYKAIERRIENNNRMIAALEATAQTIYRKMFVDDINPENLPNGWRMGIIGEFGTVVTGKTPSSNCPEDFGNAIDFITPSEFSGEDMFCAKAKRGLSLDGITKLQNKFIPKYSIAVTCIGSDMGKVRISPKECISNQQINSIIMSDKNKMPFLFFTLRNMKDYFQRIALGSSTMPMLSKSEFEKINVLVPDEESVVSFGKQALPIIKYIFGFETEIQILRQIQSHPLLKISRI